MSGPNTVLRRASAVAIWAAASCAYANAVPITQVAIGTAHESLFAVAANGQVGVAVGDSGAILENNGGSAWHVVSPSPTPLGLLGVAVNGEHAIAVGQMGVALLRDRTGGGWKSVSTGTTDRLFAVALNTHGAAVAVGAFGTALRSDDFGATWRPIAPDWDKYTKDGQQPHLYDAAIDEQGVVTLAGEFGLILRSTDGHTWTMVHQGDESIFALTLHETGDSFAVGQNGLILRSPDGGITWLTVHSGTTAILLGVGSAQDGHAIATGMHDMLTSSDGGKTWVHEQDSRFASSWYQGVADPGGDKPWLIVGHSGELLQISK